jgi:SAM-dependent methyltransferase
MRATGRRRPEWFRTFFDSGYVDTLQEEKPLRQTRVEVAFLLKALALPEGARILDVACGYGRHAGLLARRGFRVVGVDLSRPMLAEARRRFRHRPGLSFLRGDMRRMAFRAEFDAVISLYTSFGYFTPAQNEAALARMARALKPGGKLLIDHRDPGYDAALPSRLWYRIGRRRFVLEERRFDRRTKITDSTQLVVTMGHAWAVQRSFRLQEYSLAGWRRMLGRVGLRLIRAYSGYDGRRHRPAATGRLIIVAQR